MNPDLSALIGRNRKIPPKLLQRAQELRQQQTSAEQLLWECLRNRQLFKAKFRRQHNIDRFIADFYCHSAKLVIELDGKSHDNRQAEDENRDRWMQTRNITVLRFSNADIFEHLTEVLEAIAQHLNCPHPPDPSPQGDRRTDGEMERPHPPAPSPQGEGQQE